jgi:hypothetical protein
MLMILGPHTARGNIPRNIEEVVEWQTDLISFMMENKFDRVEPNSCAVDEWITTVSKASEGLLSSKIASWQTGVNRNVEGRSAPRVLGYNGGAVRYRKIIQDVATREYQEFVFSQVSQ